MNGHRNHNYHNSLLGPLDQPPYVSNMFKYFGLFQLHKHILDRAAKEIQVHLFWTAVPRQTVWRKPCWILHYYIFQWIGLRENLQETMVFTIKYRAFR